MKITLWENLLNPVGRGYGLSWDELVNKLTTRAAYRGDNEHPGWSPAEFDGDKRSRETVRRVFALCFDYDRGESIDDAVGRFPGTRCVVHTSRKHAPESPRFRLVLQLSRPVSPFEFSALWLRIAPVAGDIDQAPKDPSRFWFLPGCSEDAEFVGKSIDGEPLDVDSWLEKPDPSVRVSYTPEPARNVTSVEDRAIAYIAKMPEAIAGARGHDATWDVALMLAKGFALSEERTFQILWHDYNPRCQPPWSEKELRHKARNAKSANVPDGFKLNDDRPWQPKRDKFWASPPPDPDPDYVPTEPEWMTSEEHAESEAALPREPGDDSDEHAQPKTAADRYQVSTLREACMQVWEAAKRAEKKMGYTTGIKQIDMAIGGLRETHVTLLAAPTSWGKSSFGVMVVDENIKRGVPTLVVSVEDPMLMYARRICARRGKLNAMCLRDNDLDAEDVDRLAQIAARAEDVPFFLDAVGMPVEDVAKAIAALIRECGIKLVVCDYVGRFRTRKTLDRRNQVTFVAETLSDVIKKGNAAGLLISQLKRIEGREPTMDDVKESGDLENMAEHVLLGHRYERAAPGYGAQDAKAIEREIRVAKNKDGPLLPDAIRLNFNEVSASFTEDNRTHAASDPDPPKNLGGESYEEFAREYD